MNVFLTGGTGFIGQPLTRTFLKRGWRVTALVRQPASPRAQALSQLGVELVQGDVTDRQLMDGTVRSAMRGAELVVHNAGIYEYGMDQAGRQRVHSTNVDGTQNMLWLAQELKIPRSIYVSTQMAFGDTGSQQRDETFTRQAAFLTAYEESKFEAHEIARSYQQRGLPLIIVCPHQVVGVNDHSIFGYFIRLYVNHLLPPVAWSPDSIYCCVEVNDVAEGIALAAENGRVGETYFLCGEPHSTRELLAAWAKQPGGLKFHIFLPASLATALFTWLEPIQRMFGLPAFISRETFRAGSVNWYFSNEKAKRELGWRHCTAEELWSKTLEAEIELLARRKGQNLIERLKPLESFW